MTTQSAYVNESKGSALGELIAPPEMKRQILLEITKDEAGIFSAVALNLPGAGSCGDTEHEAIANAREAIQGVLESYDASGIPVPWGDVTNVEVPLGAWHRRITVNA